jgi:hypothetical protein
MGGTSILPHLELAVKCSRKQGGGIAIEDAVALTECLERVDNAGYPKGSKSISRNSRPEMQVGSRMEFHTIQTSDCS